MGHITNHVIFKKRISFLLLAVFVTGTSFDVNSQGQEASISFPNFGPVAFDSYWRLPDDPVPQHPLFSLSSRAYSDWRKSTFLTQHFRLDLPIGSGHSFALRMPLHHFRVRQEVADALGMQQSTGTEFGDIDVIFTIRFLKKFLDKKTNERLSVLLTGEMHTAPTGRENKQFTDVLKMLGTFNFSYVFLDREKSHFRGDVLMGFGGWDDLLPPYQKHAAKFSGKAIYQHKVLQEHNIRFLAGATYVYGQGTNNTGVFWKSGVQLNKENGYTVGVHFGRLHYFTDPATNSFTNRIEMLFSLPIKW